ncbi:uncharacterized protein LOC114795376 [Denticeps clupeoides]|uniref:Uncharacterized protein n=1 Tax=Denticeps clupeoides TaxID=299321 RepID=A0AAY4AK61_9TELE|nr:uncharacterized protein LOC114795376 [Denticeps clupeoides]
MAENSATDAPDSGPPEAGPLVRVFFQKEHGKIKKYLESEPKALGITEIMLSLFQINSALMSYMVDVGQGVLPLIEVGCACTGIIAGSVAVAARNLNLTLLKACLGLQIVACTASSIACLVVSATIHYTYKCWSTLHHNDTANETDCYILAGAIEHFSTEKIVIQVALITISATLASYCCKVIHCCTPAAHVPVITVNTPLTEQA